ncbi:MAG: TauD/TfdA family dioxygenase [Roseiarcus sp.]
MSKILERDPSTTAAAFDLNNYSAYEAWRARKLSSYPNSMDALRVEIERLGAPTAAEQTAIRERCRRANMAIYVTPAASGEDVNTRSELKAFGAALGLRIAEDHRSAESDGVVRIEVVAGGGRLGYIPYTDHGLRWHTDGYYNFRGPARCIKAMLLHCARAAASGGANRLLDPDIAYIRLRDEDPELVAALTRPDAMTIPENREPDGHVRPLNVGPVFYVDPESGALGMRYTARKRNVAWRDDSVTRRAAERLEAILDNDPLVLEGRLSPGEGLICNNVLHDRAAFDDSREGAGRLIYRIRFHDRVAA